MQHANTELVAQAAASVESASSAQVYQWGRWEGTFTSSADIADPVHTVDLRLGLTAPSGAHHTVPAFWDGGRAWRARFCPDEIGTWRFSTHSDGASDAGLQGQSGTFTCVSYEGDNPLYRHGQVRVSDDGRYLAHADGTPFFYLADTCWNGPMVSTPDDWELYLNDRTAKKFTAVQYLSTEYRTVVHNAEGRTAYSGREHIAIDPLFFERLDRRVDAINAHGLLAVPILLHAGKDTPRNPGFGLPEDQAVVLARYMVARYGGHHVLWDFVAEAAFHEQAEKWRRVGRAVFAQTPYHPVTLHPYGMDWVLDEFIDEPWMDMLGYQSAHGDNEASLRWITEGPATRDWTRAPARPIINLEPPYEGHLANHSRRPFDAFAVRRASYWSLLVSPVAGVAYGGHGVWGWDDGTRPPLAHEKSGTPLPWQEALHLPGVTSMQRLHEIMTSLPWWQLRPAPEMLAEQPGTADAGRVIVAARTEAGDTALLYVPRAERIAVRPLGMGGPVRGTWIDPRTGERCDAGAKPDGDVWRLATPSTDDWLLLLEAIDV